MSKNDDRILELKEQIELKKTELSKKRIKFMPETNCVLELDNTKYNLNVVSDDVLMFLIVKLNMYIMSADNLKMPHPMFGGYIVDVWIKDIENKLRVSGYKKEEANLKAMEAKLDKLLSEDKKAELEINSIAELLQE